ncbi:MAG TPA: putative DNA modification/repair radical SAM protein [Polyangia bacterium]
MRDASSTARLRRTRAVLADAAKYDASCASGGVERQGSAGRLGSTDMPGICHSYTPDGRCVSLLRILLTNVCVYDCLFCVNRVTSDIPRARFTPEEVVTLTLEFYRRNYIEGLFLSSGVIVSPDHTMDQMVEVARSLRERHKFGGYIHLKVVPGASPDLIDVAGRYADRLSANIELPTEADLEKLAPDKSIAVTDGTMHEISQRVLAAVDERRSSPRAPSFAPAGQTTQLVVGATASNDATVLTTAQRLYDDHRLKRVYYTAFSPFPSADARLPTAPPPLAREHRLYEADYLLRQYGFSLPEILPAGQTDLRLDIDPKHDWALRNRAHFPVDVNTADREQLLRVPGFGLRTVTRLLRLRRVRRVRLEDLARLRVPMRRARAFVKTDDHNPDLLLLDREDLVTHTRTPRQLDLFAPSPPPLMAKPEPA